MSYLTGMFDDVTGGSSSTAPSSSGASSSGASPPPADKNSGMVPMIIIGAIAAWFLAGGTRRRSLFMLAALLIPVMACSFAACTNVNTGPKAKAVAAAAVTDTIRPPPETHDFLFGTDTVRVGVGLSVTHIVDTITTVDTIFQHDTIIVTPPASGVDTSVSGDTTRLVFWHTGKIVDSTKVIVKPPVSLGKPYGPSGFGQNTGMPFSFPPFTAYGGENSIPPTQLIKNLAQARRDKVPLIAQLPCGSHNQDPARRGKCLRDSSGIAVFSRAKFDSALNTYNTPAVRAAVDTAYKAGMLLGINLMDEPWVKGGGDGNTWGPRGLTRQQADTSCRAARNSMAFKGIPVGLSDVSPKIWPATYTFQWCDFGVPQFSYRTGSPSVWRDTMLAQAAKGPYGQIFSFNVLNGGTQDASQTCPGSFPGTRPPNCAMTASQIVTVGSALGDAGCGALIMWRADSAKFAKIGKAPFTQSAATQAQRQKRPCKVRP